MVSFSFSFNSFSSCSSLPPCSWSLCLWSSSILVVILSICFSPKTDETYSNQTQRDEARYYYEKKNQKTVPSPAEQRKSQNFRGIFHSIVLLVLAVGTLSYFISNILVMRLDSRYHYKNASNQIPSKSISFILRRPQKFEKNLPIVFNFSKYLAFIPPKLK